MFFLMRMAFWLGLVLVLLPTDKTPDSEKLPQLGATEAVTAATAAVSDMSQFCTRQPTACNIGGQAATVIGHRAQSGARKVYEFITEKAEKASKPDNSKPETTKSEKKNPDHTGSIGDATGISDTGTPAPDNTLTSDDLKADWAISGVETTAPATGQ